MDLFRASLGKLTVIRAFNMICESASHYNAWHPQGKAHFERKWPKSTRNLDQFIYGGEIARDALKKHWFSDVSPHVFISHSHKDEALAMGLAGYLLDIGIEPFVDSLVWGNSNSLLQSIDNSFCLDDEKKYYIYQSRNYSTSHVHMMLASALAETIDRADAVIFLNTPNSIEAKSAKNAGDDVTASPWIYHELVTTKLVRRQGFGGRDRVRPALEHAFDHAHVEKRVEANLKVLHKPPMDHLVDLTHQSLAQVKAKQMRGLAALDLLYTLTDP